MKTILRPLDGQRLVIGKAQTLQTEDGVPTATCSRSAVVSFAGPHGRDKHLCAGRLPTGANIVGKTGEMLKLLLNLMRADERAAPLLAKAYTFVDQVGNSLAGGHTANAIGFAQLTF